MKFSTQWALFALLIAGACLAACASSPEAGEPAPKQNGDKAEIKIKGNDSISDRDLERAAVDELTLLKRTPKEYRADDAAFTMEEYYRENGYPFVRVGYDYAEGPPAKVDFRVDEGPRTVLDEVALEGRGEVSRSLLMRFFEGPTTSWIQVGGEQLFVQSRVDQAAKLIRSWYRSEGYLNVEVDPPAVSFHEENTRANIRIVIRPGLKYRVRDMRFNHVDPEIVVQLVKAIALEDEQPFARPWLRHAENECIFVLRERGYAEPNVETEVTLDNEEGYADLVFDLDAGAVYHVGKITFKGLRQTDEAVLEPHLELVEGERFNGSDLRNTLVNLYEVGIFSKIRVTETVAKGEVVDICFNVEERHSKDIAFMAGYGSYEMVRGSVSYTDRNLLGKGLAWSSALKASMKGARLESSISDPSFLNLPVTGSVQTYLQYRQFPTFIDKRLGTILSLSKHWKSLKGSAGYSFEKSWTDEVEEGALPYEAAERVNLGTVFTRWVMDDRNHLLVPDRGSKHEIGLEFSDKALAGEISFSKFTGGTSWLFPLDDSARWVLALRAEGGILVRSGDTEFIPIQFRFFSGGADSVRSYSEDELSPRRDGDFVGGEFYSTGSVELRVPLVKHMNAALFADAGNVIERRQDIRMRYYHYALGVGLRYDLPIGPIRLDWGWNPNRRTGEDLWALHLSIGFPF